jgi:hypothetical protein
VCGACPACRQTFVGDCTLVPSVSPSLYTRLFSNPDAAALDDFMVAAERLVPHAWHAPTRRVLP